MLPTTFNSDLPSPLRSTAPPPHLLQLDLLRAVAILSVFCYHSYGAVYAWSFQRTNGLVFDLSGSSGGLFWGLYPLSFGWVGVPLFFVLSGFCIHYAFLGRELNAPSRRFEAGAFFWKRFWRLYPAYLVAIGVFVLLEYRSIDQLWQARVDIVSHLLCIHNLSGRTFFSINGSFWSLAAECQFYLLFPAFLWARKRIGIGGCVIVAAAACVIARTSFGFLGKWEVQYMLSPAISYLDWCLGALVAERYLQGRRVFYWPRLTIACLIPFLIVGSFTLPSAAWARTGWAVVFAVVLEAAVRRPMPSGRAFRMLLPVGLISYSLYLLHQPLIEKFVVMTRSSFGVSPAGQFGLLFGLLLPALLGMSWLCYVVVEKQGIRLGQKLRGGRNEAIGVRLNGESALVAQPEVANV